MNRSGDNIFTGLLGFLSHDKWAELAFTFSLAWVVAAIYVCWVNYQSTFIGIQTLFPALATGVIVAFVVFIQGSEFIVPILEGLNLHSELTSEFKLGFQIAWFVSVIVDYVTAMVWFNLQANINFATVGARFAQEPIRLAFVEFVILVFSLVFLVAEVLVVVGIRALVDRGGVVWTKIINQPAPQRESREELSPAIATPLRRPSMPTMPASGMTVADGLQLLREVEEEADRPPMGFLQNSIPSELRDAPDGWRVRPYKAKPGSYIISAPVGTPKAWSPGDPIPW